MKVLIYGDHVFSVEFATGFRKAGLEAVCINPATVAELEQTISDAQPDIFMTLGTPSFYKQEMLAAIGRKPSPNAHYIHWDTDGVLWDYLEINVIRLTKPDTVFTICPVMRERIEKMGIPCHVLPFASNPDMHHPAPESKGYEGKITFVGGWYTPLAQANPDHLRHKSMRVLFNPLFDSGREVHFYGYIARNYPYTKIFGREFPRSCFHGHFPYEHIHKIFSGCFINLVPQNYEQSIIKRAFEILGSGGFGLSYDTPAMREAFPAGNGFVYASSPQETLDIVEYYMCEPAAYNRVRENALITAQKHTYRQRAETIVGKLFPAG